MLTLLGFQIPLPPQLLFLSSMTASFVANLVAWTIISLLVNFVLLRLVKVVTRRLPGDLEDIILVILRRPLIILILLYGINQSLKLLPLLDESVSIIHRVSLTILVLVVANILGRMIKDVLVYYGGKWAARTESQIDDVLVPVLSLFGPLLLVIVAALVILPLWGVNVSSVLLGAGVLGLVLGLALQETLGNIFSGLSLLMEAPFRKGDLILLADRRICEVEKLGLRSTVLFSLDEQATIFMPNKVLATNLLINLTKPTPEQKYVINLSVGMGSDLAHINDILYRIANGHPAVLSSNIPAKLSLVRAQIEHIRNMANSLEMDKDAAQLLLDEANRNEQCLPRLDLEGQLNHQLDLYKESLRNLIRGIKTKELKGLTNAERQELYCNYVSPSDNDVENILKLSKVWSETKDGWLNDTDFWNLRKVWQERNEQLELHWNSLKKMIQTPDDRNEMRLDNLTAGLIEWLHKEYKIVPGYWKDPVISIKELTDHGANIEIYYYVDNIRLEKDGRPRRVRSELNRIIREKFIQEGIWKIS
jgi:MscS family membrane protein